jgi:hypothetical protein
MTLIGKTGSVILTGDGHIGEGAGLSAFGAALTGVKVGIWKPKLGMATCLLHWSQEEKLQKR